MVNRRSKSNAFCLRCHFRFHSIFCDICVRMCDIKQICTLIVKCQMHILANIWVHRYQYCFKENLQTSIPVCTNTNITRIWIGQTIMIDAKLPHACTRSILFGVYSPSILKKHAPYLYYIINSKTLRLYRNIETLKILHRITIRYPIVVSLELNPHDTQKRLWPETDISQVILVCFLLFIYFYFLLFDFFTKLHLE